MSAMPNCPKCGRSVQVMASKFPEKGSHYCRYHDCLLWFTPAQPDDAAAHQNARLMQDLNIAQSYARSLTAKFEELQAENASLKERLQKAQASLLTKLDENEDERCPECGQTGKQNPLFFTYECRNPACSVAKWSTDEITRKRLPSRPAKA